MAALLNFVIFIMNGVFSQALQIDKKNERIRKKKERSALSKEKIIMRCSFTDFQFLCFMETLFIQAIGDFFSKTSGV